MGAKMKAVGLVSILFALSMGSILVGGQSSGSARGDARTHVEVSGTGFTEVTTSSSASVKLPSEMEKPILPEPKKEESPPKPKPGEEGDGGKTPERDFEEIKNKLREAWSNDDVELVADILSNSQNIEALAEGFRFDSDRRDNVLEKSDDRDEDPDVVTIKGIAKSALDTGDVKKLAAVMVLSTLQRRDESLEAELAKILSDRELMAAILDADADEEFLPDDELGQKEEEDSLASTSTKSEVSTTGEGSEAVVGGEGSAKVTEIKHGSNKNHGHGHDDDDDDDDDDDGDDDDSGHHRSKHQKDGDRRLMGVFKSLVNRGRDLKCDACTPTDSTVCAHCWAKDVCKPFFWCK